MHGVGQKAKPCCFKCAWGSTLCGMGYPASNWVGVFHATAVLFICFLLCFTPQPGKGGEGRQIGGQTGGSADTRLASETRCERLLRSAGPTAAYCYPYTYTDLQNYLRGLPEQQVAEYFVNQEFCRTLDNNLCNLLTITTLNEEGCPPIRERKVCALSPCRCQFGQNLPWGRESLPSP